MNESIRKGGGATLALASAALLASLALGAWWTGSAVADGRVGATLVRFLVSIGAGLYYLGLLRTVQGRRILSAR